MIEKSQYLEQRISSQLQAWIGKAMPLAALLFMFIAIADYFVVREYFETFLFYRVFISSFIALLIILNQRKRDSTYQYLLISAGVIASAVTVELMILKSGGHSSAYYAGINLVLIAALGLIPFSLPISVSVSAVVYATYLIPILILDKITNWPLFIANNVFIVSTISVALTWRILTQKDALNELNLQYDLEVQKQILEDLVAERTKELYKSQQRYRALFAYATEGILLLDETGSIIKANDAACRLYGYDNSMFEGMNVRVLETDVNEELLHDRMHRLFAGEHVVYETVHKRRDGSTLNVEVSAKTIQVEEEVFIQSFYRDVTEKKKMQEHLFQAQKMESVGLLASGIAHDFNNILSAILGYTELIRRTTPPNPKVANGLNVIENASRRAGRMISQLLDFSRKSEPEVHPFNLNDVVNDTVRMLARSIGDAVRVRLVLDDSIPAVEGDITKVGQVVMNLIVNARDAMPDGGVLTIETYGVQAGAGWAGIPPYVRAGRYVVLRMSDTGMGIPKELRGKIFEPFFTTKARGKGTGLGLAMTYGVVTEHKGYISVDSEENRGTVFTVYLPTTGRIRAQDGRRMAVALSEPDTILVVEDEETLLSLMKETLETNGYRVLAAKDPAAALEAFRKTHEEISLVITDLALPVMNGRDMVRQMRDVAPDMKVIEVSGYGGSDGEKRAGRREAFIQKPFESQVLIATVQRVLGLSGTGEGSQTITTS